MIFKQILTAILLLIASVSYSQYNYEVKLVSLNGLHPKEVLTIISKKIDYSSRHLFKETFKFESRYNYSEEKLRKIIEESGFELDSFKVHKNIEKTQSQED